MSRIAVVTSHPPFAEGGHLVIARALTSQLQAAGHEAELILTPQNRFGRQASAYLATWLSDVGLGHDGRPIDQVVSFRFPSYAIRHPVHVCWLNHRMREYYDQWPRFSRPLSARARLKERVRRRIIHAADHYLLTKNVTRLYAQSKTIQARLQRWGRIPSDVVYPPPPPRPYRCEEYGDYVFVASRLTPLKRVALIIDALRLPDAQRVRTVVAGDGPELTSLRARAVEHGLGNRVTFAGAIGEAALIDHLARCRAVCVPALAEDYGLVTLEAFASGKAVVTCVDSGGPTELVRSGENGLVAAPDARALAVALRTLAEDRGLAERMGAAARLDGARITWEAALSKLILV